MTDYENLTRKELEQMVKNATKIANKKLKQIKSAGLIPYNQSFTKKYNIYLNNKVNPSVATQKGYFKTGVSKFNKKELARRYDIMNEFINNHYASAEYTREHIDELKTKWGLKSDQSVLSIFDLYREYGYDNYKDSDTILTSMSKILGDAEDDLDIENAGEYLEELLQDIQDELIPESKGDAITEDDYISALRAKANILK